MGTRDGETLFPVEHVQSAESGRGEIEFKRNRGGTGIDDDQDAFAIACT